MVNLHLSMDNNHMDSLDTPTTTVWATVGDSNLPEDYAPTQYVAPAYGAQPAPGYMPPQQPRKSRRGLWIALAIIAGVIVLGCARAVYSLQPVAGFFAKTAAGPAITVNQYYSAVEKQDYPHSLFVHKHELDRVKWPNPDSGKSYTTAAQALDTVKGKVTNFSVGNVSTNNNIATVTVSVTRGSGPSYDVHLQLQQVNGAWKITSYDNI